MEGNKYSLLNLDKARRYIIFAVVKAQYTHKYLRLRQKESL